MIKSKDKKIKNEKMIKKEYNKLLKSEKGITMIALGVTLIVLVMITAVGMKAFTEDNLINEIENKEVEVENVLDKSQTRLDELKQEYDNL